MQLQNKKFPIFPPISPVTCKDDEDNGVCTHVCVCDTVTAAIYVHTCINKYFIPLICICMFQTFCDCENKCKQKKKLTERKVTFLTVSRDSVMAGKDMVEGSPRDES